MKRVEKIIQFVFSAIVCACTLIIAIAHRQTVIDAPNGTQMAFVGLFCVALAICLVVVSYKEMRQ